MEPLALNSTKSEEREVKLEAGTYLIRITPKASADSDAQVVGIPSHNVRQTLTIFVIVVSIGSIAVMVVRASRILHYSPHHEAARARSPRWRRMWRTWILRNTRFHQPCAWSPAMLTLAPREPARWLRLNQLLDNVNSALEVRERTEHQIRAFIADASHELRTPLAAIMGYSDMPRWTEPLSDSGQSSLARIDSQTERMSRLVEDLLTLARLDEGREPSWKPWT